MGAKRGRQHRVKDVPVVLPPAVCARLGAEAGDLLRALNGQAPVSIRWNAAKITPQEGDPVPWCATGRYLAERPVFTLDPLLHAGAYYVQEASSMLVEQAFKVCKGLPVSPVALDLCAAPGGKSTHLAALLPEEALLIVNEPVAARCAVLAENLWKWGRRDVAVACNAPDAFLSMGPFCDLVLVDAPCSGEGMFRKDPFARAQWSEGLVTECAARQHIILDAAWAVLKPGGYLIYSTCTWEERENEEQVNGLLARGAELVQVPVENEWGMVSAEPGLRCYPHRVRGEGFFLAVLRKPGEGSAVARSPGKVATEVYPEVMDWLDPSVEWRLSERDGTLYGITGPWSTLLDDLASQVRMMAPGIPVAVRKGGAWVPHPALALNQCLRPGAFHAVDLDREQVMQFLRGEAIAAEAASGAALMRFQGLGLGWGQGAGRRWNNRWPAPWRIRMR